MSDRTGLRAIWLFAREGRFVGEDAGWLSAWYDSLPTGDGDFLSGDLGGGTGLRREASSCIEGSSAALLFTELGVWCCIASTSEFVLKCT